MKLLIIDKTIFPVDVEADEGVEVTQEEHDQIVADWNIGIAHTNQNDLSQTAAISYTDRVSVSDKAKKTKTVKDIIKRAKEKLKQHYPDQIGPVTPETQGNGVDSNTLPDTANGNAQSNKAV